MNIEHISVSRGLTYDKCQHEYKLKYHLKLKSPDPEKPWFKYGKVIHTIAEKYVEGKGEIPILEITKDVLNKKIPIEKNFDKLVYCPDLLPSYKQRLPIHVKNVEKITKNLGFEGRTEYEFNYDLDPPNKKILKGFIDRLIVRDGIWIIIDYKTTKPGKWRKNIESIKHDLQLRTYAKIINKEFKVDPKNIKAALYYLEDNQFVPTSFTQESIDSAERELLELYNKIQDQDPLTVIGNVGEHCELCDYKKVCSFYNMV
jgi:ATP-dependent exoDNAse (exonuclease V) beta subunit